MRTYTRSFAELRLSDRGEVGGKCASLGELLSAGVEVPEGFAVTVAAFEAFRDTDGLRQRLAALVDGVDPASAAALQAAHEDAAGLVGSAPLPPEVEAQIRDGYAKLCRERGHTDVPVAVRSSAVAEDGDGASFAGQQETFLWVVGADSVVDHVRACWASLYTPQAIAYRARLSAQEAAEATRISVAVQAMVDAAVSGVAFTVSPRTGDRSVVAVNASWGLGHAVVSGEVTPDEFWVCKVGPQLTDKTVAVKTAQSLADPTGQGVVTVPVPEHRRRVACLDDEEVLALAELAMRVERHYGCPQDIEWALTRSDQGRPARFVMLQSRPETTWRQRQDETRTKRASAAGGYLNLVHAAGRRQKEATS
ncbi:PEP/pyruvate-binding domain-containing protein [Salinactinospora qingdaonensis]|uniref:Phosphoenolpyruvate synthase n=1 Tax=Salinactinospora qingdaonensis TaxID=702744 RepID=A0ABP7F8K3_9ACTN